MGKFQERKREEEKRKSPFLNTKACVTRSVCDGWGVWRDEA